MPAIPLLAMTQLVMMLPLPVAPRPCQTPHCMSHCSITVDGPTRVTMGQALPCRFHESALALQKRKTKPRRWTYAGCDTHGPASPQDAKLVEMSGASIGYCGPGALPSCRQTYSTCRA